MGESNRIFFKNTKDLQPGKCVGYPSPPPKPIPQSHPWLCSHHLRSLPFIHVPICSPSHRPTHPSFLFSLTALSHLQLQQAFFGNLKDTLPSETSHANCRSLPLPPFLQVQSPASSPPLQPTIYCGLLSLCPNSQMQQDPCEAPAFFPTVDPSKPPAYSVPVPRCQLPIPRNTFHPEPQWLHLSGPQKIFFAGQHTAITLS